MLPELIGESALIWRLDRVIRTSLGDGQSRQAAKTLRRIIAHRRVARYFFQSAYAVSIPMILVVCRGTVGKREIHRLLLDIKPFLADIGLASLSMALEKLHTPVWVYWGMKLGFCRRAVAERDARLASASAKLFELFGDDPGARAHRNDRD